MTPEQIRQFQAHHKDWFRKPLIEDGLLGPKTLWALAISRLDPHRQAIVSRATGSVGITESEGPNRSSSIDYWNTRAGAALGSPYCASFASWCLSVDGMPELREAGAQTLGSGFPGALTIQAGDLMWFPTGPATGHCGIVIGSGIGDGGYTEVACVEGNQNNAVRLVRRRVASPVRIARVVPAPEHPGLPPGLALVPAGLAGTR